MIKLKRCRSILAMFCAALLLMGAAPRISAVGRPSVYAASYSVSSIQNAVNSGDKTGFSAGNVDIMLNVANGTGMPTSIKIGGNFSMRGGTQFIDDVTSGTVTLPLYYDGKGKDLSLTFYYKTYTPGATPGTPGTVTDAEYAQTILAAEAVPDTELGTVGTPRIRLDGELPELVAGEDGKIMIKLTNTSKYDAFGVKVKLGSSEALAPSNMSSEVSAGDIKAGKSETVAIGVTVLPNTKSGYYSIPITVNMIDVSDKEVKQEEKVSVKVSNLTTDDPSYNASVTVSNVRLGSQTPSSDGSMTLFIDYVNAGKQPSGDVKVALSGFSPEAITLNEPLPEKILASLEPGATGTVAFKIKAASALASGNYPLALATTWKTSGGEDIKKETTIYVPLQSGAASGGDLRVSEVVQGRVQPGADNRVDIALTIKNEGSTTAKNVVIKLKGLATGTLTLAGGLSEKQLGDIPAGKTIAAKFPLYVDAKLGAGNYNLTATISCAGSTKDGESDFFVSIKRPANFGKTEDPATKPVISPQIIISSYSIPKDVITAGESFMLSFSLKNTSKLTAVKNMKVTVSQAEAMYLPTSGSNAFYVENLDMEGTVDLSIGLSAKRDAESKSYPLTIAMVFQDKDGKEYTVSENLSLPLVQEQRLDVGAISYSGFGMEQAPLSFQYTNKGRATLFNLTISVEGPFTSTNGAKYVGNYAASSSDYFEDYITPNETGELTGKVVFEYEDAVGTPKRYEKTFTANIQDMGGEGMGDPMGGEGMGDPAMGGEDMPVDGEIQPEGAAAGWPLWLILTVAGGGAVVVAIAVIIIVRKRRDKRLLKDEDENS